MSWHVVITCDAVTVVMLEDTDQELYRYTCEKSFAGGDDEHRTPYVGELRAIARSRGWTFGKQGARCPAHAKPR